MDRENSQIEKVWRQGMVRNLQITERLGGDKRQSLFKSTETCAKKKHRNN